MVCNGISILSGFAHPFFAPNESLFWHCYGAMSMLNWIKYACTFQKNPPNDYIFYYFLSYFVHHPNPHGVSM